MNGSVAGLDEVGRGTIAGPVVAAAVVIKRERITTQLSSIIDDSKKLSPKKRKNIACALKHCLCGLFDIQYAKFPDMAAAKNCLPNG